MGKRPVKFARSAEILAAGAGAGKASNVPPCVRLCSMGRQTWPCALTLRLSGFPSLRVMGPLMVQHARTRICRGVNLSGVHSMNLCGFQKLSTLLTPLLKRVAQ
jgi:hypothetical protein